jgi:cysteinylglycine-S-conjugate dipeptidase
MMWPGQPGACSPKAVRAMITYRLLPVFADTFPDAELILMGVEEPLALIHAPNESVDPTEIASMALTEARFLQRYAEVRP